VSFTPYGLYAGQPTTYTTYIDWGAESLKKCDCSEMKPLIFAKIRHGFGHKKEEIRKKNINFENDTVLVLV
jgi:hypothetical protein